MTLFPPKLELQRTKRNPAGQSEQQRLLGGVHQDRFNALWLTVLVMPQGLGRLQAFGDHAREGRALLTIKLHQVSSAREKSREAALTDPMQM